MRKGVILVAALAVAVLAGGLWITRAVPLPESAVAESAGDAAQGKQLLIGYRIGQVSDGAGSLDQ